MGDPLVWRGGPQPGLVRGVEPGAAGGADGLAAAVVLVVGGDVADALVQPHGVVEGAQPVRLGFELAGVAGLLQVRELALEVPEERLDPGLVVGGAGTAGVLGDPGAGHEGGGGARCHLRAVAGQGQQDREPVVAIGDGAAAQLGEEIVIEQVLLAVGDQRAGEGDLDLRGRFPG